MKVKTSHSLKILVKAPYYLRKKIVMARDNIKEDEFIKRDTSSNDLDFNSKFYDIVINNDYNLDNLEKKGKEIYEKSIISGKF